MKKIGKLGTIGNTYDNGEISYFVREINCIVDKLNEIIDQLNQSQKQPEGETIRNYNPEKGWDKYKKSKIEVREFDLIPKVQPEKQEEWREEFKVWFYKAFTNDKECYWIDVSYEDVDDLYKQIENRVSQLLSERTFSKQELTLMQKAVEDGEDWAEEWMVGDVQMRALEKIDKLLKEEE